MNYVVPLFIQIIQPQKHSSAPLTRRAESQGAVGEISPSSNWQLAMVLT